MGASNPAVAGGALGEFLRGSPAGRRDRLPEKVGASMRPEDLEEWIEKQFPRARLSIREPDMGELEELVLYLENQLF
ncbi:MAG: hypothetical protein QW223_09560 [Candidatus Caldarchaeum sp.]